jgi:glycosyltransferase involved in cell wall biosynthesis
MKILHVTRLTLGGVGNAVFRLHEGLLRLGYDSTMFVSRNGRDGCDPTVRVFVPPTGWRRLRRRLRRWQISRSLASYRATRPAGYDAFTDSRSLVGADLLTQLPPCDIVSVNGTAVADFVDHGTFLRIVPQMTPVVETLHSMESFTGGCHYDWGCGKHKDHCGACPQLGSHNPRDLSHQIWQRKYRALQAVGPARLHIVTPSRWLADEAKSSRLLHDRPITVIPLGLDTEKFSPRDRRLARETLGVAPDALAILFVAHYMDRAAKGFSFLVQALHGLENLPNVLLISAGNRKPAAQLPIPNMHLDAVTNERLLSLVYSAADVLVVPSVQDNFPQTPLEAMACGTPVIAFAVGGLLDSVRPGVTGILVPPQDVTALRAAIRDLLQNPAKRAQMAAHCRRVAVNEYNQDLQARRYIALYERVLDDNQLTATK